MANEIVLRYAESEFPSPRNVMAHSAPLALGRSLYDVPGNGAKSVHNSSHSGIASRAVHEPNHLP